MATDTMGKTSTARLAEVNPEAVGHYRHLRATLHSTPGIDAATCETVLALQLAALGHERPFKIHALRAIKAGVPKGQLQQLVVAGLGLTMLAFEAARALEWLDQACDG